MHTAKPQPDIPAPSADAFDGAATPIEVVGTRVIAGRRWGFMTRAEVEARNRYYATFGRRMAVAQAVAPPRRGGAR